jgi:uncharacterized protein with HEPN domain
MSRLPRLRLFDIQDAIDRVFEYVEGLDYDSFLNDQKTQDAVARNIEIIGEASRALPQEFRERAGSIPWQEIVGMRNIVIHEYFGILPDVVWDVIQNELPVLKKQIVKLLAEMGQ